MTGQLRLSVQECLLPGDTLLAKWDAALACGFEAIELRGQGGHRLRCPSCAPPPGKAS